MTVQDVYQCRYTRENGEELVEILRNGGQIHAFDERFRFGRQKARMLLAASGVIAAFARDGEAFTFQCAEVEDPYGHWRTRPTVERFSEFTHSSGRRIIAPWLRSGIRDVSIGIGLEKARAFLAVEQELRAWLMMDG